MPRLGVGVGIGVQQNANSWTPSKNASFTWFEPSPANAFSDAGGTVPSTIGGVVQTLKQKSGPAITLTQATGAAQPILQQAANGKYYLACTTAMFMESTASISYTANTPFSLAVAYRPNATIASPAAVIAFQGSNKCLLNNTGASKITYAAVGYGAVPASGVKCSWILTTTGGSGVDPTFLINGVSQTVTSGSGGETYPVSTQKLSFNERTGIGTWIGPQDFFGFGIINGAQLSASDLTNLNAYMNNLMLGA